MSLYDQQHRAMVQSKVKSGAVIAAQMGSLDAHLLHMAVGASGEAGELLDAVKKATIYREPLDLDNVIEELGDLEFFMQGLRASLGITRGECLRHNMRKLGVRFPDGYSDAAAVARADKVVVVDSPLPVGEPSEEECQE